MPGRFAETLDSGPQDNWMFFHSCPPTKQLELFFHSRPPTGPLDFFFTVVGLDDNLNIFFLGRIPTLARARLEASMPGRWCGRASMPGRNVALGIEAGRASKRVWASQYSLGEPSNKGGRASTKGPSGEPVLIGRTRTHWARLGRAIKRGWGEPVLRGRWASQYYALRLLGVKSARLAAHAASTVAPLHLHSGLPLVQRPPLSQ